MKYTLEDIEIGERQHDGSRFVSWFFCVDGEPVASERDGMWFYSWKTDAEIALALKKRLRDSKAAFEMKQLGRVEL